MSMAEAAEHVPHQLPDERTWVKYLLDSIKCKDLEVLARMTTIWQDDAGMHQEFELMATFIIPICPIARKGRGRGKHSPGAEIVGLNSNLNMTKGKLEWNFAGTKPVSSTSFLTTRTTS